MAEFGSAVNMTEDYIVVASGRADIGNTICAGALAKQPKNGQCHWELGHYSKSVPNDLWKMGQTLKVSNPWYFKFTHLAG